MEAYAFMLSGLFTVGAIVAAAVIFFLACVGLWHLDIFQRPKIVRMPTPNSSNLPPVPQWYEPPRFSRALLIPAEHATPTNAASARPDAAEE